MLLIVWVTFSDLGLRVRIWVLMWDAERFCFYEAVLTVVFSTMGCLTFFVC